MYGDTRKYMTGIFSGQTPIRKTNPKDARNNGMGERFGQDNDCQSLLRNLIY